MSYDQMRHTHHDENFMGKIYKFYKLVGEGMEIKDNINNPLHYRGVNLEAIDVIEAFNLNFSLGNSIKYILRADHKHSKIEDLEKAIWYLKREISRCKS